MHSFTFNAFMSAPPSEDETQLESQDVDHQTEETQPVDEEMGEVETDSKPLAAVLDAGKDKPKKGPKEFVRQPGRSLFPIARVQKIIKADKVFVWYMV
jgi:DNA polymerase epsilon subunit 4